jgi:uncharacterized protein YuzE
MKKCHKIQIPKDVCYIKFGKGEYHHSIDNPALNKLNYFTTIRGEDMIFDIDKKGRIIGIELLGSKTARKPCQTG